MRNERVQTAGPGGEVGRVVLLNGTSSSGTTSTARALQEVMETPYLHTGPDHCLERVPARLMVRWEVGPDGLAAAESPGEQAVRCVRAFVPAGPVRCGHWSREGPTSG
jgi:chloramphenicol 3-O-phosphotransferase